MTRVLLPGALDLAAQTLREGHIVGFPTDTVYGVAVLAQDENAVQTLFAAKGRDFGVALPVMVAAIELVEQVARPVPGFARLAARFWPGPLTIVLPKQPGLSALVTAGGETVGVRIPDHPLALDLLRLVGAPLAVTSANRSGQPPARVAAEVLAQLDGRIHTLVDGGPAPGGSASTVLDLTTDPPQILRPGPIAAEALAETLQRPVRP